MSKKTPEEIASLKAKYGDKTAEKEAKRAAKKEKFGSQNADQNMPAIEMRIPYERTEGGDLDIEKPPWDSYCDALEHQWRFGIFLETGNYPAYPVRRKVVRT